MTTIESQPPSVSFVKMEERKRPSAYDADEVVPPPKRQATTVCVNGEARGHSDADFPGKDDLEKFQKDAIYRQMQEYKREKITLETQLQESQRRCTFHDDHLRNINSWFEQLIDEIRLQRQQALPSTSPPPYPSSILTASKAEFQAFLDSRSKAILSTIEQVFSQPPSTDKGIEGLQEDVAKLLTQQKEHINELERAVSEKKQLEERLETASMRYMVAEKKLDRARSMTVAKLERQATAGGRSEAGSGLGGAQTKDAKPENTPGQVDEELLAEAQLGRTVAEAASAKQKEHLDQLAAENAKLAVEVSNLTMKQSRSSEDDFARSDLFKQLKMSHDDAIGKGNHLEALNQEIRQELSKLHSERTIHKSQLEAEIQAIVSDKDVQLSRAESDLARIRTIRDELHADLQARKAAQEQERTSFSQVKQQAAAREEQIKALESNIERLSADQETLANGTVGDLPIEELRTKYANLERQYKLLNGELQSMSQAYKKLSTANSAKVSNLSDLEEKVMRLSAEKAKAEQKYFATMKTKEAREQEVRALRAQNAKSSDIVSQLKESDAAKVSATINLEKQLAESNDALVGIQLRYREAQQLAEQRRVQTEGSKKELEEVKAFVATKDTALSESTNASRKLELQVEELKRTVDEKDQRIQALRSRGQDGSSGDDIRSLVICTICRTHLKNVIVKTCGHTFCENCVEDRLQNRMRKCPNCNRAFGMNDYMRFTL